MDEVSTISMSNDLESLETEFQNWMSLSYYERKRSDELCLQKYGCTNIELYNQIKASLLSNMTDIPKDPIKLESYIIEGGFKTNNKITTKSPKLWNLSKEPNYKKVELTKMLLKADKNISIISDFVGEEPDYTLTELLSMYDKYLTLPDSQKDLSNDFSHLIWNRTVPAMYVYMRTKFETLDVQQDDQDTIFSIKKSLEDKEIENYQYTLNSAVENEDVVEEFFRRIDCVSPKKTLIESVVLEDIELSTPTKVNNSKYSTLPYVVPFMTFDELPNRDEEETPFTYIFDKDQKIYFNEVKDLQRLYQNGDTEAEDKLLKLGWNPEVPIDGKSIKRAKEKQLAYLNTNHNCIVHDVTKLKTDLPDDVLEEESSAERQMMNNDIVPVYIVLSYANTKFGKLIRKIRGCEFTHAGLSLEPTLGKIYSYNFQPKRGINGLSIEKLDDYHDETGDCELKVLVLFVEYEVKEKLKAILAWFENNIEKTRYSFYNLFRIVINKSENNIYNTKMVCSQFVDSILKMINIDITGRTPNLVAPDTFEKMEKENINGTEVFAVYNGKKSSYNWKDVKKKTKALIRLQSFRSKIDIPVTEAVEKLFEYKFENFDMNITDNERANELLQELVSILTPYPVIMEMKTPIGFTKSGGLYIRTPKDLQNEYNEAHKLLYMYDATNIQGIKHELARLFYINSIIEKKLKKIKDNTSEEYKDLIDLRARVLNDFTTYFKVVRTNEPSFDFMNYMKSSEYYNKNIVVDNSTLKYSGSYIKKALSSMLK